MTEALIGIGVILVINVIVVAFGYGKLIQQVSILAKENNDFHQAIEKLSNNLDEINIRLTRIEGKVSK